MNKYKYTPIKMTPFKWFVLENFPFIEEDFDSLTSYGLWCKLKEFFDEVATKTDEMGTQVESLTDAFTILKDYVDNYFKNLDVQDEIDNKLDEMVEDGTFTNLISTILNVNEKVFYYVEDYGAKGDGITDDSQAFENAFADAETTRGIVATKTQSKYLINSPVHIPRGCSLFGHNATIYTNIENDYVFYVNSLSEDTTKETVQRDFTIIKDLYIHHNSQNFNMNNNGIHFACHGLVDNIRFYKIDKCVRFCHTLYADRFTMNNLYCSTRTNTTNYAFDFGDNGDAHVGNLLQQGASEPSISYQAPFVYMGQYKLNAKLSNIIGNGIIYVKCPCIFENIMLSFYGIINIETKQKNITINGLYASTDYIKNGRINIINANNVEINNANFINSGRNKVYATGEPITYTNANHIILNNCSNGCRYTDNDSNYGTSNYINPYTENNDLLSTNKTGTINLLKSLSTSINILKTDYGNLTGTFKYKIYVLTDEERNIMFKTTSLENTIELNNEGARIYSSFFKNKILYVERTATNNETVSAILNMNSQMLVDLGNQINGVEWSSNLLDTENAIEIDTSTIINAIYKGNCIELNYNKNYDDLAPTNFKNGDKLFYNNKILTKRGQSFRSVDLTILT